MAAFTRGISAIRSVCSAATLDRGLHGPDGQSAGRGRRPYSLVLNSTKLYLDSTMFSPLFLGMGHGLMGVGLVSDMVTDGHV